ncbi:putative endoglucanase E1 [Glarea lozoyensis 74030]|uniref:Putative endoglucanase E1 n=1 Tax=Glarea lozoyensis (strain ATCC 74030 / MF5533) TaxID=1104152 RepID=H0EIK3_GLAL7|nr:putative endoglucanase E1 [Glarea lozoyensis 74030]
MRVSGAGANVRGIGRTVVIPSPKAAWPYGPLVTDGRWIRNTKNEVVTPVGVNWPGHGEAMIPEGLQYASINKVLKDIKSLNLNIIRLTFSIQMIDEIYSKGNDTTVKESFLKALGTTNGTAIYKKFLQKNPQFDDTTTRLQVFDAVAAEALKQEIYVHLDNHISRAEWCCGETDGNAWFGDTYFNVANWKRGLAYMADHGKAWPALVSLGLRNEPRNATNNPTISKTYNWETWYKNMIPAANGVNAANPGLLIYFSGLNYDTTLAPITTGANLGSGTVFRKSDFPYSNKLVLELHNYQTTATTCPSITNGLYNGGYNALNATDPKVKNVLPVVMTEWGHDMSNNEYKGVYQTCLDSYLGGLKAGWMFWEVGGSYYTRQGKQDFDETWALFNHDWTNWRQKASAESIKEMAKRTLAGTKKL